MDTWLLSSPMFTLILCPIHAPSSNRAIIPTQIVNGERDDAVNLNPIALDRFTVSGDKRPSLQSTKIRHPVVADQDEISRRLTGVVRVS